jgi:hypothetical protein
MFGKEDNTYNELRDKSIAQWLEDMSSHDDITVRGGVKVTKDYIAYLKKVIVSLENKSTLKDEYLKKLKSKK